MRSIANLSLGVVIGFMSFSGGLVACSGDAGPAGAQGAQGEQGAAGTPGAAGTSGNAGTTGPQGPAGTPAATPPTVAASAVYTTSNDPTFNEIVVYARSNDGTLTPFGSYQTGGRGTGAGLGDQGALVFDAKTNSFFAVNAGDNSISMLALRVDGSLALISKIGSGGVMPVSVTLAGDVLYVVNAGDATHVAQISGFKVEAAGLAPIASSTQPLSAANPAPAQIQFTPDGALLVVTEKGTNTIDTFVVTNGVAAAANAQASSGMTPFGFAFSANQKLLVSEAFGGGAGQGATSSYSIAATGVLTGVSKSAASTQTAPCWVAVSGTHAYVANTGSNTVTSYAVAADGTLTLANADGVAGATGAAPADLGVTPASDFLFVRNGGDHSISIFAVSADGSIAKKSDFAGIPQFSAGLVVR